ncbi:MAG: YegS/Rv2252/BmrU family lipid kinase [Treponema sp.]|nr:YegS/Rv2252/BmrU family lipid kinase [Treponema sp.]
MLYFVVNPVSRSGRGIQFWEKKIEPVLKKRNVDYKLYLSKERGDTTCIIEHILSENSGEVTAVVLGGDGTLDDAVQGISDFDRFTLGYIPTGSSNDFARDMNISHSVKRNLEHILEHPEPKCIDIGEVRFGEKVKKVVVSCGIGFDAAVCQKTMNSRMKKVLNKIGLGKLIYLQIALNQIFNAPKCDGVMEFDDGRSIPLPHILFCAIMLHRYEGGGFKFCPNANCTDGILDVCAVKDFSPWRTLVAIPSAFFGGHTRFKGIDTYTCASLKINLTSPLWLHTDGEVSYKTDEISVRTFEKKLRVLL